MWKWYVVCTTTVEYFSRQSFQIRNVSILKRGQVSNMMSFDHDDDTAYNYLKCTVTNIIKRFWPSSFNCI